MQSDKRVRLIRMGKAPRTHPWRRPSGHSGAGRHVHPRRRLKVVRAPAHRLAPAFVQE